IRLVLCGKEPLPAGRETCAAAAAQAGLGDYIDDVLWGHFRENLAQRLIAVDRYVLVDVLGIDNAAVAQRNAVLFFIERRMVQRLDGVGILHHGLLIKKALDNSALEQMLLHDLRHIVRLDHAIERALWIYDHNRAQGTEAEAARTDDIDLLL